MSEPTLSSFIESVADLLRGDYIYVFKPPRALAEIDADLKGVTGRILTMIGGLSQ
ncbi:hypothetical protein [Hyalangium sp.]|uniref:hypothetical protein n=1 Tax=Hyalangium sp. TaxID=2028555 RepID=UPI002D71B9D0|nr:hypothetical protein [Hyalangium sp.]HYH94916.1 hypothetical protein [Hyalangium sp.]